MKKSSLLAAIVVLWRFSSAVAKGKISSCDSAMDSVRGKGLILDLPGCGIAEKVGEHCGNACPFVLCSTWDMGEIPADPIPSTAVVYHQHFSRRVREVPFQELPSLLKGSLDFLLIKHTKVESAVDQKAEIESIVGTTWGLVKPGGVIGILSDKDQQIVVKDADGGLWLDSVDYVGALKSGARDSGFGEVRDPTILFNNMTSSGLPCNYAHLAMLNTLSKSPFGVHLSLVSGRQR